MPVPNHTDDDAFLQRVLRWQDHTLTPDELAALEREMLASPEKRRVFAELQVRSALMRELLRRDAYGSGSPPAPVTAPNATVLHRFRWVLAAAAMIALAAVVITVLRPPNKTAPVGLAVMTYEQVAEWEDGQGPADGQFAPGSYALASGTIRLALAHDGTVATLAGPARFDLVPPGHIRLHEGRLSARVSQPDKGFTVFTEAATVLDRGTVFGVEAKSDGEALVSVLEGTVDVQKSGSTDMTRIEQGSRVLVHPQRDQTVQPDADVVSGFEDLWPLTLGVDDLSHLVEFVLPRAKHKWSDYRSDTRLFLMPERQRVKPTGPLTVDIAPGVPLDKKRRDRTGRPLAHSGNVNSYLLFFRPLQKPVDRMPDISGAITFSQPVLGIISDSGRLVASDEVLGHPRVAYRESGRRGIENRKKSPGRDVVRISRDRRRVYFNLHATSDPDEFRVLVAAP
jgi:ferric-dicitrate binding protein FerR (iron transport regulator)